MDVAPSFILRRLLLLALLCVAVNASLLAAQPQTIVLAKARALAAFQERLAANEQTFGPDHPQVASSLFDLASHYLVVGRYDEAERLYKRCLAIREKARGVGHPEVGQTLFQLAVLYFELGRYQESEALLNRSLAIFEASLDPDHPSVAAAVDGLAALYAQLGRDTDVESFLKRSQAISQRQIAARPNEPTWSYWQRLAQSWSQLAMLESPRVL